MNPASGTKKGYENELKKDIKKIWTTKEYKDEITKASDYKIYKENYFSNFFKYLG
ncbi:MAG: hypothetical protein ABF289_07270 [Clostridiales bacterium]